MTTMFHRIRLKANDLTMVLLIISSLVVLLPLRFDWSYDFTSSARAATLTSILFLLIQFFLFCTLKIANLSITLRIIIHLLSSIYLIFPFSLLQMTPVFYKQNTLFHPPADNPYLTQDGTVRGNQVPNFLYYPEALLVDQFPYQTLILAIMFFLFLISFFTFLIFRTKRKNNIFFLLYFGALVQGILHSGLHAPLTQNYFYTRVTDYSYRWYLMFLFPNSQGAVNADWPVFVALEQIFWGPNEHPESIAPNTLLIRRPLVAYLLSTLTFFVNSYYIWIFFNSVVWILAIFSTYKIVSRYADEKIALVASFFVATGPIFLLYFASPWSYFSGVAVVVIVLRFFDKWIVNNSKLIEIYAFLLLLVGTSLIYDQYALILTVVISTFILKRKFLHYILLGSTIAAILPWLLVYLFSLLGSGVNAGNSKYIVEAFKGTFQTLSGSNVYLAFFILPDSVYAFLGNQIFLLSLPIFLLAILGAIFSRKDSLIIYLTINIMSTAFIYTILKLANSELSSYPRVFSLSIFSWYILAAYGFGFLLKKIKFKWLKYLTRVCIFIYILLYANLDLVGYPGAYERLQFGSFPIDMDYKNFDFSNN